MTHYPTERTSAIANAFAALYELALYLRSEHGCPWDRAPGLESMHKWLRDETLELGDAIDENDSGGIAEEWGDVLFILLMLVAIAEEAGHFKVEEALRSVEAKMIRRHPHLFGSGSLGAVEEIISQWDKIKAEEKSKKPESLMDNIPLLYSTLKRADYVQKTAAAVGFDWADYGGILEKIGEEVDELREALAAGDTRAAAAELGDLLFSCVNLARFTRMDAESLLGRTIDKFVERFKYIESELSRTGKSPNEAKLSEMDELWEKSKTKDDSSETSDEQS
ncbi:MAG: nucleoside triphosphate pyrophosphohydrolase [Candidatus Hydrogenedentota bacterium]|nr:MAG: nucleoside triphosphate pyrophosphohydrolase [Candidatus Hydrogenedentota bacterium]